MAALTKPQTARRPIHMSDFDEDDLLKYPYEDGEPMAESEHQLIAMMYIISALKSWFADDPTIYVGGDMFIYYREGHPSRVVAPDVFVVFGVEGTHKRLRWRVWDEGGALPSFILEVGSESTWREDAGAKRILYADLGVEEYWRLDPQNGALFSPALIGERLMNGGYEPIDVTREESGYLRGHSPVLGLDICVRPDGETRLYDPAGGQWLNSLQEEQAARQEAQTARQQAEAENRRLREQLARLLAGE